MTKTSNRISRDQFDQLETHLEILVENLRDQNLDAISVFGGIICITTNLAMRMTDNTIDTTCDDLISLINLVREARKTVMEK